ncbi:hypothetical protein P691DRAFT_762926 [Macrolepiota fuliginosa MF-IS2]|uniref:DUF6533 domain-containing protein n=1 Tax=Macrolepiota fuliginosa MF-IS2 TaxID=1400762 RepID=A0A9P5X5Q0_9AGAR|nr:hypothetical protein P691DRAFT_762926 [Macrolepiota fuliginosa MF-IS2]
METSIIAGVIQELITGVQVVGYIRGATVAGFTVMILDWLLTFEMEVPFIWQAPWTTMKVLYLLERYVPFIDVTLAVFFLFADGLPVEICGILYRCVAWMFFCRIAIANLVFTLRTWIVWEKHPRVGLGLLIFYISTWVVVAVPFGLYLQTVTFIDVTVPHLLGCAKQSPSTIFSISFAASMVYNTVIRAVSVFRSGANSSLMRVIYRDGILYYIYMFIISFLNFLVIFKLSNEYVDLLLTMERVLQSVLACRVVLHIRQEGQKITQIGILLDTQT